MLRKVTAYCIGSYESNGMKSDNPNSGYYQAEVAKTLDGCAGRSPGNQGGTIVLLEYHPQDSRIKIKSDGAVQSLSGKMGTGGNNVPLVMEITE